MVAELPPDKMPPPQPTAITLFQRVFRVAAELELGKADLERYEEFLNRRIYSLLLRGEANAKWSGDVIIEPWNVPITAGLQECINAFKTIDETIELQPILDRLEKQPPLGLIYSDDTEGMLREIGGGLSVALARAFKIIDPELKHPHSEHWDHANRIFNLLL
jgi:hypothetical protein